ncbi:MAG TPA: ribonuclease Z [Gemmatimonadaceae bacterium]|nr:ribonuclease Z [Gemmatimonadaceae bacterium]
MRLTTIGTGTAAPTPGRVQAGHLVEAGGVRLLLDCGGGVVARMAELGTAWQDITHVALTHFHADHTTDLANLAVAWRYGQLPPRSAPVTLFGPPGTRALVERMAAALWESLTAPGFPFEVREIEPGGPPLPLGDDVTLAAWKVPHTDESVAYSVERGGRRLVYTGDTAFDPALGGWASSCDVLLCECSLPRAMAVPSHLTPEECGALAAIARPRLLALTHLYPPVERVDVRAIVAERFHGPVVIATDGWSTEIEDRRCWW